MIQLMKASAGSGKTYNLAKNYIELLKNSSDPYAYRHILAVTFTNKATDQMKERILKFLYEESKTSPKAGKMLRSILHDYSAFSVSTIDKFFQQTLKAFSREIGQFASYQVELDVKSLTYEAMDRILDSLSEDNPELIGWLNTLMMNSLKEGDRFNLERILHESGDKLRRLELNELLDKYGIDKEEAFSKERLSQVWKCCDEEISDFQHKLLALDSHNIKTEKNGTVKYQIAKQFYRKATAEELQLMEEPYKRYRTALMIKDNSYSLGIASAFFSSFKELMKEKNVINLDDSNAILKNIIDGSDAPFVYEKLGVRYEHFLLDEFQDTSTVQWENFLPLIKESEAYANANLIVGDVKQSIYRWRGSDWKLLQKTLPAQFPAAKLTELRENWRSCRSIVEFNNEFFPFASTYIDENVPIDNPRFKVSDIYSDVRQEVRSRDPQTGQVEVIFMKDENDAVKERIVELINSAVESGAHPGDIAILVRTNSKGTDIASYLIDKGFSVVSDDSLLVRSSKIVRRLISMLNVIDEPDSQLEAYLSESIPVSYPDSFHSLPDLCETLLREIKDYDEEVFIGDTMYIQSFMDYVQDWTSINGNNLRLFLKAWKENNDIKISSPEDPDSVKIMSVHKSKGLEFPYVIFPYAEDVSFFKNDTRWIWPQLKGTRMDKTCSGIYPVEIQKELEHSCFSEDFFKERSLQLVDAMNLFYVATTRAEKKLTIILDKPSAENIKSYEKDKPVEPKSISDLMYVFTKTRGLVFGHPYDFRRMSGESEESWASDFVASYTSFPIADRLKVSQEAFDYFSEAGTGLLSSKRIRGTVLHDILSRVDVLTDLKSSILTSVGAGELPPELSSSIETYLTAAIKGVGGYGWFDGQGNKKFFRELSLFDSDGSVYRPDRVIVEGEKATVIDYKFGEEKAVYLKQVRRYMCVLRKLGYEVLNAYLWYPDSGKVVSVEE